MNIHLRSIKSLLYEMCWSYLKTSIHHFPFRLFVEPGQLIRRILVGSHVPEWNFKLKTKCYISHYFSEIFIYCRIEFHVWQIPCLFVQIVVSFTSSGPHKFCKTEEKMYEASRPPASSVKWKDTVDKNLCFWDGYKVVQFNLNLDLFKTLV